MLYRQSHIRIKRTTARNMGCGRRGKCDRLFCQYPIPSSYRRFPSELARMLGVKRSAHVRLLERNLHAIHSLHRVPDSEARRLFPRLNGNGSGEVFHSRVGRSWSKLAYTIGWPFPLQEHGAAIKARSPRDRHHRVHGPDG